MPPIIDDEALAVAMQAAELEAHDRAQAAGLWAQRRLRAENGIFADPVWGELEGLGEEKAVPHWRRVAFLVVPCCLVSCASTSGRRAWRRFALSWATALAVVQVLLLLIAIAAHGGIVSSELNPSIGPHPHALDLMGAKNAAKILEEGQWWRILTPMVLHSGVLHLAGNLLVQLRTGVALEVLWGHSVWVGLYVASGACATLASCAALPDRLGVGSSGALCGLIGAWLAFTLITWNQTLPYDVRARNQQVVSIAVAIVVILGLSFMPMLDFAAHAGGLAAGAVVAMLLFAGRMQHQGARVATRIVGAAMTVALVVVLLIIVLRTDADEVLLHLCDPDECP